MAFVSKFTFYFVGTSIARPPRRMYVLDDRWSPLQILLNIREMKNKGDRYAS